MTISNEVKVGILAVVALALSLWGYKFIMGKNALVSSNLFYVEYRTVDGLQKGTPVRISGFPVGVVADLYLKPNDPARMVVVTLDLRKEVEIPKDTKATIISTGFMGGKAIVLEYDKPCAGEDCAKSGDYLQGVTKGLLASMLSVDDADAYVDVLKEGLNEFVDTLNNALLNENSNSPIARTVKDLRLTMANLQSSTGQLDGMLRRSSGNIEGTLANFDAVTTTLKDNNDKIKSILANADNITSDLAEADLQKTMAEVKTAISELSGTLNSANSAIKGVNTTVSKINQGEGTLGKLLQDDALYNDLKAMSTNIDSLVNDIEERPYRYLPLKSRRKVQKYDRLDAKEGN
ncbi:MAG: MCE family protein [Saprospiraceae bacterium]|nr:MCE family protein [Saprospiraceae bacterium]